jgi:ergothioneine biosynthesis protein EgtB
MPTQTPSAKTVSDLRTADAATLPSAWADLRSRLLSVWEAYQAVLDPSLTVRYLPELNPPRWELGHIAWFEEFWIARNTQRHRGHLADPLAARAASLIPKAEALYDSSAVAHARRWQLDLPDARRTRHLLDRVHDRTLTLLAQTPASDDALYFFRLAAMHEAMHLEAWLYMAQALAVDLRGAGLAVLPEPASAQGSLTVAAQNFALGYGQRGFAFDNELSAHEVAIDAFEIDAAPVTWAKFLPFVEAGGYELRTHWTDEGWRWRQKHALVKPAHCVREDGTWKRAVFGQWHALDPQDPAIHLSAYEAQAWCRWAGRRLPTEAEWECAAVTCGEPFAWGQVWEWTSSSFAPYAGFEAHPYRDYSQPWFDGRPVLRGSSFATWPGLRHPRYRNYFTAERTDIFAGFRSCAV